MAIVIIALLIALSMITVSQLISAGITPFMAKLFQDDLNHACNEFNINTTNRISAFVAQAMIESANFIHLEENLYYTSTKRLIEIFPSRIKNLDQANKLIKNPEALANTVYSDKLGNGNFASGDGWKFRGRGIFQLTGKDNYAAASTGCRLGTDCFVNNPEYLIMPYYACLSAAWFWSANGLNELADEYRITDITKKINSGLLALAKRKNLTYDNREIFV